MHLHEYQVKQLFADFALPVPAGRAATSAHEAAEAAESLGGSDWVVKAQIHAGGRGKGGGVRQAGSIEEVRGHADSLLGSSLVTPQTGPRGLPVNTVLVEQGCRIARELYVGLLIDRSRQRITVLASAAGGMDIETLAAEQPEAILSASVDPAVGLQPYQCRCLAFGLGLGSELISPMVKLLLAGYRLFTETDASLLEINPLVVTADDRLLALDAKLTLDDSALFRHKTLAECRDETQEDERERRAREHGLNYIPLDGDIACMVNGAGLAMATMDLIKLQGGEPANFLDVGGTATAERVSEAFKLILSDANVRAILVNIFGGIVRCDLIADGIIQAVQEMAVDVPVIVRLEGTNAPEGRQRLEDSGFNLVAASGLTEAADKAVAAARGE